MLFRIPGPRLQQLTCGTSHLFGAKCSFASDPASGRECGTIQDDSTDMRKKIGSEWGKSDATVQLPHPSKKAADNFSTLAVMVISFVGRTL